MKDETARRVPHTAAFANPGSKQEGTVDIAYVPGELHRISAGGHRRLTDRQSSAGGGGPAPTTAELFVTSPAACMAYYAGRYLHRHGKTRDGLRVQSTFAMAADRPARVARVTVRLAVPADLTERQREVLLSVVRHCTVHNSLLHPPEIEVELG
ncbi:OsmC family protein [Streptomyces sp. CNQ-509]|uniref:OsmC family protein n=1 Tax=Streptomyces sp. CNQ-509 TaxID=444103 RepID=UPI00069A1F65|nr:OsmC family protein [Streptomyces sp. CNQ-509]